MDKKKITLAGSAVFCREWIPQQANGEAIILLHGVESHCDWFEELGRALADKGYASFAYDRPGWGSSPGLPGHLAAYSDELARLEALANALRGKHQRVHLAGLSWGGMFALYAALRRGALFDTLSLIAPGICPLADLSLGRKILTAGNIILHNPQATLPTPIDPAHFTKKPQAADYINTDAQRTKRITASFCFETLKMRKFCQEYTGKRLLPPCGLFLAGDDKIVDNAATRKLLAQNPAVEITEYPGMEHSLIFECPQKLAEDMARHLARRAHRTQTAVVLGAGAVGSMVGALLANGGVATTLIGRRAHVDAVNNDGLLLELGGGRRRLRDNLQAVEGAAQVPGAPDLLIVAVKSFDTTSALEGARNLVGPQTVILSLQNGAGNERKIADLFPENTVLGGAICAYLDFAGPGQVVWSDDRGGLAAGFFSGNPQRAHEAADILRASGLEVVYSDSAARVKWSKLLLNTAFNALNAATGLSTAEILAHPEYGALAVRALREGFAVMAAQGIAPLNLPGYDVGKLGLLCKMPVLVARKILAKITARDTRTVSSMRQDVQKGRGMTEIDEINGAIVTAAKRANLPAPANERLCLLLREAATVNG